MKEKSQKQDSRYLTDLELRCEKKLIYYYSTTINTTTTF